MSSFYERVAKNGKNAPDYPKKEGIRSVFGLFCTRSLTDRGRG